MSNSRSTRGRTIRIFLADGSPNGVLTAEIMNWIGKVVVAPRARLPDLVARTEVSRTGVYILSGADPQDRDRTMVYIGESDNVRDRLVQHNKDDSKDFFSRIFVVVSKDENLTKAHVRYLEGRLIELTKLANRAKLANSTAPGFELLPESDRSDMEFFVEQIALVLPVLGYEFAQPIPTLPSAIASPTQAVHELSTVPFSSEFEKGIFFEFEKGSVKARLLRSTDVSSCCMAPRRVVTACQDGILTKTFVIDLSARKS